MRGPPVRVLRAGVDGGLAGPGNVAGQAAGAGRALVRGHGVIVAEFFDAGQSRTVAWERRPQVAALAGPGRGWDAIVVGEYERAFYGSQYASMAPLFEHYGDPAAGTVQAGTCHAVETTTGKAADPGRKAPHPRRRRQLPVARLAEA